MSLPPGDLLAPVIGPIVGAAAMSVVNEVLSTTLPDLHAILFGALVIVLIMWCPGGLVQAAQLFRSHRMRRAAPVAEEVAR